MNSNEDYWKYVDMDKIREFEYFLIKVNERTEFNYGLRDAYEAPENDPALGPDVEYFGPVITKDDRMRYIIENIVSLPDSVVSPVNKIGNTIISHFYGARGIHTVVTGIKDPKKAHVDFEAIGRGDKEYTAEIYSQVAASKAKKMKFYGTTELHTSLQTAARNFCRVKYNDPTRPAALTDIIEWIGEWSNSGFIDKMLTSVNSLEDMYKFLKTQRGVGEYYGYHCATSNSVNPALPYQHDEEFNAPGPGARDTLHKLFPSLQGKLPYDKLVVWLRKNQKELFPNYKVHEFFHNYILSDGTKLFADEQNELKVYTTEVACCQYGVYCHLKANPHLVNKRKVARLEESKPSGGLDELF